jgi:hypothetical protein
MVTLRTTPQQLEFKDHSGMSGLPDTGINGNAVKVDQLDLVEAYQDSRQYVAASRSLDLASDDGGICAHLNQQMASMSMAWQVHGDV